MTPRWPKDAGGGRGLLDYGGFCDARNSHVAIRTSSEAGRAYLWIFHTGGSLADNDGAIYLSRRHARQLRAALDRWLTAESEKS